MEADLMDWSILLGQKKLYYCRRNESIQDGALLYKI